MIELLRRWGIIPKERPMKLKIELDEVEIKKILEDHVKNLYPR